MFTRNMLMICAVLLAAISAHAQNSTPSDVSDLVGARAAGGETQLKNRGYRFIKTEEGDDRSWSNWWNARKKICLNIVTMDGRYDSIVSGPSADCNQSDDSGGGSGSNSFGDTPSDVADLVGAKAASGENELKNRGYRFIKTQEGNDRKWSNWWNSKSKVCLSVVTINGRYNSIVSTPAPDCDQSNASGGGSDKVDVSDLVGVRASSGESEMQARGFRNVDALTSGDTSYTIWYRKSSRQCIQVATVDGRYDSLTDIQTHSKCR